MGGENQLLYAVQHSIGLDPETGETTTHHVVAGSGGFTSGPFIPTTQGNNPVNGSGWTDGVAMQSNNYIGGVRYQLQDWLTNYEREHPIMYANGGGDDSDDNASDGGDDGNNTDHGGDDGGNGGSQLPATGGSGFEWSMLTDFSTPYPYIGLAVVGVILYAMVKRKGK